MRDAAIGERTAIHPCWVVIGSRNVDMCPVAVRPVRDTQDALSSPRQILAATGQRWPVTGH
jgi:hypothetical protein